MSLPAGSGHAFGLALDADCALPGLDPAPSARPLPAVRVRTTDERTLLAAWRAATGRDPAPRTPGDPHVVDVHPGAGCFLRAPYFGAAVVAPDGGRVDCAPPASAAWRWQRFLVGRALPVASAAAGYDVLHASAVVLDGRAVALTGPSGVGKTSLALHAVLAGHGAFLTDDVLAVERGEALLAHPGFPVSNVRLAEDDRLGDPGRAALGELLGSTARQKRHYAVARHPEPAPLAALAFLRRVAAPRGDVVRLRDATPPRLLGAAFLSEVSWPGRLLGLLELTRRLLAEVVVLDVQVGTEEDAAALAGRLVERCRAELAA